jgi:hypothetical protein
MEGLIMDSWMEHFCNGVAFASGTVAAYVVVMCVRGVGKMLFNLSANMAGKQIFGRKPRTPDQMKGGK